MAPFPVSFHGPVALFSDWPPVLAAWPFSVSFFHGKVSSPLSCGAPTDPSKSEPDSRYHCGLRFLEKNKQNKQTNKQTNKGIKERPRWELEDDSDGPCVPFYRKIHLEIPILRKSSKHLLLGSCKSRD